MEIGTCIRCHRKAAGVSLRRLAKIVGVDPAYLSRVERGMVHPSDTLLQAIAAALKIDGDELLLLAGRVPESWKKAILVSPGRAAEALRSALATCAADSATSYSQSPHLVSDIQAIEEATFPFEHLSEIAELESWRKEINRPIFHIHKWWAQRLGSVFRAILLGTFAPQGTDVLRMFYQPVRLDGKVIFDPFMGSGTTLGEGLKLGARVIGRDINPVAYFAVRNALSVHRRNEIIETFRAIERDTAPVIKQYYRAQLPEGGMAEVLYYFWVKVVPCPKCEFSVDLFSSYIFAQHAYPSRNPQARAVCPQCGAINVVRYDTEDATCSTCSAAFRPKCGPARGATATCPNCGHNFPIAKAVRRYGRPPSHRLYAKLVLRPDGSKQYLPVDLYDLNLYEAACRELRIMEQINTPYPVVAIEPGYNTDQVLNYCYTHWHEMFNERQLLCLGILAGRIQAIPDAQLRDLFTCLFSGTLEFNNMFASFKGEGTGAVRHMFFHHILKPERTPLEANIWGTPRSSGSFSTLFESRILRALDYAENPFEVRLTRRGGKIKAEKVYGLSCPLGHEVADTFAEFQKGKRLYLSCGDSATTDLPAESVDAVITDPPYFDNVNYSQLADFFYVWQRHILGRNGAHSHFTTRAPAEVQQTDPITFTERLTSVFVECYRVLRPEGLLVFTYHHSRAEGWRCILEALLRAGFVIVATHPITAEMAGATPKRQAKEPINLDVIIVCRKRTNPLRLPTWRPSIEEAVQEASEQVTRLRSSGRKLSRNDVRVVLMAQIIKRLSWHYPCPESSHLDPNNAALESAIDRLYRQEPELNPIVLY